MIFVLFGAISGLLGPHPLLAQEPQKPSDQNQPPGNQPPQPQLPETQQPEQAQQPKNQQAPAPSMKTQAAVAAVKSVEFFDLLEKRSVVFPDIALNTTALSPGKKFELFIDNSVSVHTIIWASLGALVGQAADSPTGFGVGASGYPKRFATSLARESSGEFFGTFVLASALHQDPRFFPERAPTLKSSVKYSVKRLFVTRNNAGENVANVSGLLGPALGEALANVYWPDQNRTVGDTLLRYGLDLAARSVGNVFRNYWPVFAAKAARASRANNNH